MAKEQKQENEISKTSEETQEVFDVKQLNNPDFVAFLKDCQDVENATEKDLSLRLIDFNNIKKAKEIFENTEEMKKLRELGIKEVSEDMEKHFRNEAINNPENLAYSIQTVEEGDRLEKEAKELQAQLEKEEDLEVVNTAKESVGLYGGGAHFIRMIGHYAKYFWYRKERKELQEELTELLKQKANLEKENKDNPRSQLEGGLREIGKVLSRTQERLKEIDVAEDKYSQIEKARKVAEDKRIILDKEHIKREIERMKKEGAKELSREEIIKRKKELEELRKKIEELENSVRGKSVATQFISRKVFFEIQRVESAIKNFYYNPDTTSIKEANEFFRKFLIIEHSQELGVDTDFFEEGGTEKAKERIGRIISEIIANKITTAMSEAKVTIFEDFEKSLNTLIRQIVTEPVLVQKMISSMEAVQQRFSVQSADDKLKKLFLAVFIKRIKKTNLI